MSDRPGSPDSRRSSSPQSARGPGEVRPMSAPAAVLWTAGTTLGFVWLVSLTIQLREAAKYDSINSFICQAVAYLAALFLILRRYAPDASIRELLALRKTHPGFYPLAILLGLALEAPTNAIYGLFQRRFPELEVDGSFLEMISGASTPKRIVIGLILIALGPALEEVFFRGALFQPLRRRLAPAAVVVLTSLLFALAHIDWREFVAIFLVGLGLGGIRAASGSILPSFLMHATYNAVPYFAVLWSPSTSEPEALPPVWLSLGSSAAAALLLLGAARLGSASRLALRARGRDAG